MAILYKELGKLIVEIIDDEWKKVVIVPTNQSLMGIVQRARAYLSCRACGDTLPKDSSGGHLSLERTMYFGLRILLFLLDTADSLARHSGHPS